MTAGPEVSETSVEDALALLRPRWGRMTSPRRAIVTIALASSDHTTAEQLAATVQELHPDVHPSTVYRVLHDMEAVGLLRHIHLPHGPAIWHSAGDLHGHVVCDECGVSTALHEREFAVLVRRIEERTGFAVDIAHVALAGRCRQCRDRSDPARGSGT